MPRSRRAPALTLLALMPLGVLLAPAPAALAQPACTITGTAGADEITGTSGDDVICAGDGDDLVDGAGGNDTLRGGYGLDTLQGGAGDDQLHGDRDDDALAGGEGSDLLFGDLGTDDLFGDAGDDRIEGGDDNDEIAGGDGADTLRGGLGTDRVLGDSGPDQLHGDEDTDWLFGGEGDDTVEGGFGTDEVHGGDGADQLRGGADTDLVRGGIGTDTLLGEFGTDDLDGGPDTDTLDGGGDGDTCASEPTGGGLTSCETTVATTAADQLASYATASAPEPLRTLDVTPTGTGFEAAPGDLRVTAPVSSQGTIALTDAAAPAGTATIDIGIPGNGQQAPAALSRDDSVVYDGAGTGLDVTAQVVDGGVRLTTVQPAPVAGGTVRYDYPLTLPPGATVQIQDGAVAITSSTGGLVAAVAPPWAQDARGVDLPTRYELAGSTLTQVVDTSAPGTTYPVVADPFFGIRLIGTVRSVWGPRGLTYAVQPTAYGRAAAEWIHARHGWPEARSKGVANRQGLYEQYVCHPISGLARVKSTWNLDTWRPTVGLARTVWHRCNP